MTNDQIKAATSDAVTAVKQRMATEFTVSPAPLARPAVIISAAIVSTKHRATELCADCDRPIYSRLLRVVVKEHGSVRAHYFHPDVDEDEEIRGCAPDHPLVRAALRVPPGNPEAIAEVQRFDVAAVGRRCKALLAGIAVVRLPGELP